MSWEIKCICHNYPLYFWFSMAFRFKKMRATIKYCFHWWITCCLSSKSLIVTWFYHAPVFLKCENWTNISLSVKSQFMYDNIKLQLAFLWRKVFNGNDQFTTFFVFKIYWFFLFLDYFSRRIIINHCLEFSLTGTVKKEIH